MNANRKRLMFDLTVWVTTPLLVFALLAADSAAKSPRPAGANPIERHLVAGAADGNLDERAVKTPCDR